MRISRQAGFTLIEVMIVLVIIALLMGFLIPKIFSQGEQAKQRVNKLKMQSVSNAINQFNLEYSGLPQSLDDLVRCTERTGSACIPTLKEEDLRDGWNQRFLYNVDPGARKFTLKSPGPDGVDGGGDDMVLQGP
jgi:general secretion pathway protein G